MVAEAVIDEVLQCRTGLGRRDRGERLPWLRAERPATGGEHDSLDVRVLAGAEGLMHGRVFAVDGQDRGPAPCRQRHHERPGHHERFLVGQGHRLAGLNRRPGAPQAGGTHDRRDHPVDGRIANEVVECFRPDGEPRACRKRPRIDVGGRLLVDHNHPSGPHATGLFEQGRGAAVGCEQPSAEPTGGGFDHVERAAADAPRRPEDGHAERSAAFAGLGTGCCRHGRSPRGGIVHVGREGGSGKTAGHHDRGSLWGVAGNFHRDLRGGQAISGYFSAGYVTG